MNRMQFEDKMKRAVANERLATNEVLEMIVEGQKRSHHLAMGYASIFDWLTRGHGYTEGSAYERMKAAKVYDVVPDIAEKLQLGTLTLTSLAKAQRTIEAQEKVSGKLSVSEKTEVIQSLEGLSLKKAETKLAELFPDVEVKKKGALNFDQETLELYQRLRDLLSHTIPDASLEDVFKYIGKDFLKRRDPLLKTAAAAKSCVKTSSAAEPKSKKKPRTAAAAKSCVIAANAGKVNKAAAEGPRETSKLQRRPTSRVRRIVIKRDGGKCQFTDALSGLICGNTYQVEVDHIIPYCNGGSNDLENLRCLCRAHNQHRAREMFD